MKIILNKASMSICDVGIGLNCIKILCDSVCLSVCLSVCVWLLVADIPVFPTVTAVITLERYEEVQTETSKFLVPRDYHKVSLSSPGQGTCDDGLVESYLTKNRVYPCHAR